MTVTYCFVQCFQEQLVKSDLDSNNYPMMMSQISNGLRQRQSNTKFDHHRHIMKRLHKKIYIVYH